MGEFALIGFLEAAVYLLRYRSATARSPWWSAVHTFCICSLRVWFILAGVSAAMAEAPIAWLIVAYAGSATLTTLVLHEWLERRKEAHS